MLEEKMNRFNGIGIRPSRDATRSTAGGDKTKPQAPLTLPDEDECAHDVCKVGRPPVFMNPLHNITPDASQESQ